MYNVTGILKNEKADNSAISWDIKLKIGTGAHLEDVLDMFSVFNEKLKIFGNVFKNIFSTFFVIYFNFWRFWKSKIAVL